MWMTTAISSKNIVFYVYTLCFCVFDFMTNQSTQVIVKQKQSKHIYGVWIVLH